MAVDRARAAAAIAEFLAAIGRPIASDRELARTPELVADAWIDELTAGYAVDVGELLRAGSSETHGGAQPVVVLRDLTITTMCPHHLLPAHGHATIAYWPGERLAGIGVLAQTVDALAHRLTLQETLTTSIVSALTDHLGARGAAAKLSLVHGCFAGRGERRPSPVVTYFQAGCADAAIVGGLG